MASARSNPYLGDAVQLARHRKERDAWERGGRRGPPPAPPAQGRKNPPRPGSTSVDYDSGRAWARKIYEEKLATGDLPALGRGFPDEVRAARGVQSIAVRKLTVGPARAGLHPTMRKMPKGQRAFWQGVLDQANDLVREYDARHHIASRNPQGAHPNAGRAWTFPPTGRTADTWGHIEPEEDLPERLAIHFGAAGETDEHGIVAGFDAFAARNGMPPDVALAVLLTQYRMPLHPPWFVAHHLAFPGMQVATPAFVLQDEPDVGKTLTVRHWDWVEGETEVVDEHGNVFDYNVLDYPREMVLVGFAPRATVSSDVGADLEVINAHRRKTGMAALDPAAAGWTDEDVAIEARRLRQMGNPRRKLDGSELDTLETLVAVLYEDADGTRTFYVGDDDGRYAAAKGLEKKGLAVIAGAGGRGKKAWREVAATDEGVRAYERNPGPRRNPSASEHLGAGKERANAALAHYEAAVKAGGSRGRRARAASWENLVHAFGLMNAASEHLQHAGSGREAKVLRADVEKWRDHLEHQIYVLGRVAVPPELAERMVEHRRRAVTKGLDEFPWVQPPEEIHRGHLRLIAGGVQDNPRARALSW